MRWFAILLCAISAIAAPGITQIEPAQQWSVAEFQIHGAPALGNPFDPAQVLVTGTFTSPSGKTTTVEGFWFQDFQSTLAGASESLTAQGSPEWRMRFMPDEAGVYNLSVLITSQGPQVASSTTFDVAAGAENNPFTSVPKITASREFFEVAGKPLVLNGANVCWPGGRGTYDYIDWFPAMGRNGANFARLWMCPWAFGLEAQPASRTNYNLRAAWQLDRVMRIAQTNNLWIMLCLDYHGMFQTVTDQFGGNDNWKNNPYNATRGGPCAAPNDFFTNATAREIYKKRLRYLIARYGASPNLLCWEFFNEIDNAYNVLNGTSVAQWHSAMAPWLKQNDPYRRLVTTSLTGSSDRAEIWNATGVEFAQYHSYGMAQPVSKLPPILQSMRTKYNKLVLLSEYGIDSSGFHAEKDPYYRGLRQGIWAGLLSGSAGAGMSWWWEEIHSRNLYGVYNSIAQFLDRSALGQGDWDPIQFVTNGGIPTTVGDQIPGGTPFNATLNLNGQWGFHSSPAALAIANTNDAARAPAVFNAFFHGTAHADLRNPCVISAWAGSNAKLVLHLNSVSQGAIINVRVDGASVFTQSVPNLDGGFEVNNEYNRDYTVNLASGKHSIEIRNSGADWFYLDWIRLENVQPANYAGNWTEAPVAIGMKSGAEALVYIVNPVANYPGSALIENVPPMVNANIRLTNWPAGKFTAVWHDAKTFQPLGKTTGTTTNNVLQLPLPDLKEDVSGRIIPANRISQIQLEPANTLKLTLEFPAPANSSIESSNNFETWQNPRPAPFATKIVNVPWPLDPPAQFFRFRAQE